MRPFDNSLDKNAILFILVMQVKHRKKLVVLSLFLVLSCFLAFTVVFLSSKQMEDEFIAEVTKCIEAKDIDGLLRLKYSVERTDDFSVEVSRDCFQRLLKLPLKGVSLQELPLVTDEWDCVSKARLEPKEKIGVYDPKSPQFESVHFLLPVRWILLVDHGEVPAGLLGTSKILATSQLSCGYDILSKKIVFLSPMNINRKREFQPVNQLNR